MAWPGVVRGISTGLECPWLRDSWQDGKTLRNLAASPATLQLTGIPFSPAHSSRSSSHHAMSQGNTRVPAGGGSGMGGKSACRKAQIATRKRKSRRDFAHLRCALEVSRHLTETARDAKPEQMPVGSKRFLSAPPSAVRLGFVASWQTSTVHCLKGRGGRVPQPQQGSPFMPQTRTVTVWLMDAPVESARIQRTSNVSSHTRHMAQMQRSCVLMPRPPHRQKHAPDRRCRVMSHAVQTRNDARVRPPIAAP